MKLVEFELAGFQATILINPEAVIAIHAQTMGPQRTTKIITRGVNNGDSQNFEVVGSLTDVGNALTDVERVRRRRFSETTRARRSEP